jgi:hypothetical protein
MRGMRDLQGRTWDEALLWRWSNEFDVPDLSDPATLGCVLALVREACGYKIAYLRWGQQFRLHGTQAGCKSGWEWSFETRNGSRIRRADGYYDTEAEALVAALEAAP